MLVSRASGRPLGTFLEERLLEPLGMTDTAFWVAGPATGRLATSYLPGTGGNLPVVYHETDGGQWSRPGVPLGWRRPRVVGRGLPHLRSDHAGEWSVRERTGAGPAVGRHDDNRPVDPFTDGVGFPRILRNARWGFGVSVVTRRTGPFHVGTYGWDGGLGTSWYLDPAEEMITILMTQVAWPSPAPPPVCPDFWTAAYQAIDD